MKCECDKAGHCTRRNCEMPAIHFKRCKAGQVAAIDNVYMFRPERPKRKGIAIHPRVRNFGVGAALKAKITNLLAIKTGGTCGCNTLARQLDIWGPDECEARREWIVDRLVENRAMVADAMASMGSAVQAVVGWTVGLTIATPVLRAGANWMLTEAIQEVVKFHAENPTSAKRLRKTAVNRNVRVRPPRIGNAFRHVDGPVKFITAARFQEDIKILLGMIPNDITAIAGVARSGLSAATMLSMYLHLPMITIRQTMNDIVPTGNGWRLGGSKHVDPKGKILVVDDTVMTGNSLRAIRPLVESQLGSAVYASVYVNPLANVKPDIWACDLQWPHLLEWNLFNSILSPSMAVDFDGILCRDCPSGHDDDGPLYLNFIRNAAPLYVPRRVPIPLIVTARLERYRTETEAWLRRYGIRWQRLVMHSASTLQQRQRDDIPNYKARHYRQWAAKHRAAPGPIMFCESEDWQARRIAQVSKLMVICPHTAGVY